MSTISSTIRLFCLCLLLLAFPFASARAQCDPQWLPGEGVPGTDGPVNATAMWDPDGPGPATPRLVIGGEFTIAGNVVASRIAMYDPETGVWSSLGSGMDGYVYSLAVLPNGDLIAGGGFTIVGGVPANNIARWDGSAWSSLGSGMNARVRALAVLPNGDLLAGGDFTTAGAVAASRIARWDGSAWSPLGSGMDASVHALAVLINGDLVAGGDFSTAGAVSASRIARWDGSAWSSLSSGIGGGGFSGLRVSALAVLPSGDLVAGGDFTTAGGVPANNIARWNGSLWSPLGSGIGPDDYMRVSAIYVLPSGDVVAGGSFATAGGVPANSIARWDGSTWSLLGAGVGGFQARVNTLAVLPNGNLIAGGNFTTAGGVSANNIARWDASVWSPLASGMNADVYALAVLPNGNVIAGGYFTTAGGVPASRIARWDGSAWSPFSSGMGHDSFAPYVSALAVLPNGDLVAGGSFTSAGGAPANNIARWDGSAWSPLGSGIGGPFPAVRALAVMPNGDLVAGGDFNTAGGVPANDIARWDGSAWSPLGTGIGGLDSVVESLAVMPNGDLVAGGFFPSAGGVPANCIARWDGSAWSPLGSGMDDEGEVLALAVLPSGDLIAGGWFTAADGMPVNRIARWDGSAWSPLSSGMGGGDPFSSHVSAITVLPGGDLVAGGVFTTAGGVSANNIARWSGSAWAPLSSGIGGGIPAVGVSALAVLPNGELAAGGNFTTAGGTVSAYFARYSFTGGPTMSVQPAPQALAAGDTLTLSATPANGYTGVSVQWHRNGASISDGPGGASTGGGAVSGASAVLPSPTDGTPSVLTITGAQPSDAGEYTAVFTNSCGSITSDAAAVTVTSSCPADLNGDGLVDFADYLEFLNLYDAGDPRIDFNGDGLVDFADYLEFLNLYDAGC